MFYHEKHENNTFAYLGEFLYTYTYVVKINVNLSKKNIILKSTLDFMYLYIFLGKI